MNNITIKQTLLISSLKIKQYYRIHKLKLILGIIVLAIISLIYGFLLFAIAKGIMSGITQPNPNQSSTISQPIFHIDLQNYSLRDLFVNSVLAIYLSFLLLSAIKSAVGIDNPFVSDKYDTHLQLLIPVNPYVSFLSCKIKNTIKNGLMVSVIIFFLFSPLFIAYGLSFNRMLLLLLNGVLGVELMSLLGNLIFFLLTPIRLDKDWTILFADKANVIISTSQFIVPILFLQLLNDKTLLTYQALTNFYYIPFVNVAIGNTGLLLRSGIPMVAYYSIITLILQIILILVIILIIIKYYHSTTELGDLLPALEFLQNRQQKILLESDQNPITPTISKVDKNTKFNYSSILKSVITKDKLLFQRINEFKGNLFVSFLFSIFLFIMLYFNIKFSSSNIYIPMILIIYLVVFVLDTMVKLFYSISLNEQLLHSENWVDRKEKIFYTVISSLPLLLLFIAKPSFLIIFLIVILYLIAEFLNKFKIRSFMISMVISVIIGPIFYNLLTLI